MALAPDAPPLRKISLKAGRKDSVASVAKRYHVSAAQVAQWNEVGAGRELRAGPDDRRLHRRDGAQAAAAARRPRAAAVPRGRARRAAASSAATRRSQTARAGKATGVRQTPVAKR